MEAESRSLGAETRVIKRYANRKLYDTRESCYVTLREVAEFVRHGEEVQIIDNRSKEDLTSITLAQIIYEQEREGGPFRSIRSLRDFIRDGKGRFQEGRERLIESLKDGPVGKLIHREASDGADAAAAEDEPGSPGAPEASAAASGEGESPAQGFGPSGEGEARRPGLSSPKEVFDELSRFADDRVKGLAGAARHHVQTLQGEVRRLQARIEELEGKLGAFGRRGKREPDE